MKSYFQMTFSLPSTSCLRKVPNIARGRGGDRKGNKQLPWTAKGKQVRIDSLVRQNVSIKESMKFSKLSCCNDEIVWEMKSSLDY